MARGGGCRDCTMCTGHAFTGVGRSAGRAGVDIATLGITRLARRTCKVCGHPMSEHAGQRAEVVQGVQPVYVQQPVVQPQPQWAPGWYPDAQTGIQGQERWWDGQGWTVHVRAIAAPEPAPALEHSAAEPAASSQTDELERLADLHARGILDDDEFKAAKAKVLGI